MQFIGNFTKLHSLAEKVLKKSFPKKPLESWDTYWIPNANQIIYDARHSEKLIESWAYLGEIIWFNINGYKQKDIENYSMRELGISLPKFYKMFNSKNAKKTIEERLIENTNELIKTKTKEERPKIDWNSDLPF